MERKLVHLHQLVINPDINPRHGDVDVSGLVAQIKSKGFNDPLWVRPLEDDQFEIIDGSRRVKALTLIAAEKGADIRPADSLVPVDVFEVDDKIAREMALAANVERTDLTPADEAEAFHRLNLSGLDAETIAARFGKSVRLVKQRIAIGSLPAPILNALRQGKIGIEDAQAFTKTTSAERQLEIFNSGKTRWHQVNDALLDNKVRASDGRVEFVGLEAYEAAGGTVTRDLFDDKAWVDDEALLDKLFEDMVEATLQGLKDDGWSNVQLFRDWSKFNAARFEYAPLKPKGKLTLTEEQLVELDALKKEKAELVEFEKSIDEDAEGFEWTDEMEAKQDRHQEVEAEIAELTAAPFTPTQKKKSAAVILISNNDVEIKLGLVKQGSSKSAGSQASGDDDDDAEAGAGNSTPVQEADVASYSDAMEADLAGQMQYAIKLAMVTSKPAMAARMGLAARLLAFFSRPVYAPFAVIHRSTNRGSTFQTLHQELDKEWAEVLSGPDVFATVLARLEALQPEEIIQLEAVMAADMFQVSAVKNPDVQFVIATIDPDVKAEGFSVGKDFLKRMGKTQLLEVITETDPTARIMKSAKKPDLVDMALMCATKGWLPRQLRTPSYVGPGSTAWIEALAEVKTEVEEAA